MARESLKDRRRIIAAKAREAMAEKRKKGKATRVKVKPVGIIRDDESYPVESLQSLFGIGPHTVRKAERGADETGEKLPTAKMGSRKYVNGRALREHLDKLAVAKARSSN